MDPIASYFNGEKLQCLIGAVFSLAGIGISVYLFTLSRGLFKGIAWAVLPLSLLLLVICVGVVLRSPKDIVRVNEYLTRDPAKMHAVELPRMQKVMRSFKIIKRVEVAVVVIGLVLAMFLPKVELVRGLAIGLIFMGAMLYLFDHVAETRGARYVYYLEYR